MKLQFVKIKMALVIGFGSMVNFAFGQCPTFFEDAGSVGVLSATPTYIGCAGANYTVNVRSNVALGPYTIVWGDASPNSTGASLAAFASVPHIYTYPPDNSYTISITANGCTAIGLVVVEKPVNASIQIPIGGITQACAPKVLDFLNSSTNVSTSTTFTWDFGDGTPILVRNSTNAGMTESHQYNKGTVNCQTVVTLTAENYCSYGTPTTAIFNPILIWDIDDAAIAASATILCYPDTTFTFSNASNFNCTGPGEGNTVARLERWNFGKYWNTPPLTGPDSIIDWQPVPSPPNTLAFPGVGSYTVFMEDSNQCGVDPAQITVQIVPPPQAAFTSSDDTICAGETVTFQNTSTGGANVFAWNFGTGGGFVTGNGGNRTRTYNTAGTYTISLAVGIAGSNCGDTATFVLEVLPTPNAAITINNQNACDSLDVIFSDNSTTTSTLVSWDWDFDNGQTSTAQNPGLIHFGFPSNFNVTLEVTNNFGCSDITTQVINVYQTPIPIFTPTSICEDELAQFMDLSTSAAGDPINNWTWNFGDGSPNSNAQNPTHTYTTAGPYLITFNISTAHCSASDTTTITVEQLPAANFTKDKIGGCSPLTVNFTNGSSVNATSFLWIFGDGDSSTQITPSHVFLNNFGFDTTFYVKLIAYTTYGCTDTIQQAVNVFPNPVAAFVDSSALIKCSPSLMRFNNFSSNGAASYFWNFGNGKTSTAVNPLDTFYHDSSTVQTVTVTLVAYSINGCSDTTTNDYLIFPKPSPLPLIVDTGCAPLTVQFPATTGAVIYNWNFGDGFTATGPTPTHTYNFPIANTTLYNVRLISTSAAGCKDTSFGEVKMHPKPQAFFTPDQFIGCQPFPVTFTSQSVGAIQYHWNFDDGIFVDTTSTIVSHIFYNNTDLSKTYHVQLVAESQFACVDTFVDDVTVHPEVISSFSHDTIGCSPFTAVFTNSSTAAATLFGWDFGDGGSSISKNPVHGYLNNGNQADTFLVTLIATSINGCGDTSYSDLVVFPTPVANFTVNPQSKVLTYPDTTFIINNLDLNWQYIWDFGDGTTSNLAIPGSKGYTGWGSFTIKLIAYNEMCKDSMDLIVTILPPVPIADFGEPKEGCEDLTVDFVNKSKYGHTYKWRFVHSITSAQQSSADENPVITFTDQGIYNVSLTVTGDGGVDIEDKTNFIEVFEQPTASFIVRPTQVFVPNDPVICSNTSRGDNLTFTWDFGDGSFSNSVNPEHYYQTTGNYSIKLVVSNQQCVDSFTSPTLIDAIPSGGVSAPNAFTPNTQGDPSPRGDGGATRSELFGTTNDAFWPVIVGELKNYEFLVYNKWGEMLFRTEDREMGWTGWYRKRLCQQDVYVYKVKALTVDNKDIVLIGDITLLR